MCAAMALADGARTSARAQEAYAVDGSLALGDVVRLARLNRAELEAAGWRVRVALAAGQRVAALEDPVLAASVDHLPFELHGVDASLTIEQRFPLDDALGRRRRVEEARADVLRAEIERVRWGRGGGSGRSLNCGKCASDGTVLRERELADRIRVAASARYAVAVPSKRMFFELKSSSFGWRRRACSTASFAGQRRFNAAIGAIRRLQCPGCCSGADELHAVGDGTERALRTRLSRRRPRRLAARGAKSR